MALTSAGTWEMKRKKMKRLIGEGRFEILVWIMQFRRQPDETPWLVRTLAKYIEANAK